MVEACAGADGAADGEVDDRRNHMVCIEIRQMRIDALGEDDALGALVVGEEHGRVGGHVAADADEGLNDAEALDLVVVGAALLLDGAQVEAGEQVGECHVGRWGGIEVGIGRRRGLPHGLQAHRGEAAVHEAEIDARDGLLAVSDVELAAIIELTEHGGLDLAALGEGQKCLDAVGRHGEGHALLGLGDEDLPGGEALILEGAEGEIELGAARGFGHLADARAEAAGAVVGDAGVEPKVAGLEEHVGHLLLGEGVADLHRLRGALGAQLLAREGGAVDAVLADAAAGHHYEVAGVGLLELGGLAADLPGQDAEGAAVDERLAEVALVENLPAPGVGDAALIAAVDDALVHAVADAPGVEQPLGQVAVEEGVAEAVAPHVDLELRAAAGAEGIAVHAHDAGHGAAVGVERGGAVVGLDLVGEAPAVVEGDDAGVVVEHAEQPGALPA